MKVKFISLASGSSGNCYYIGTEKYGILIDAGIAVRTIKKGLKEAGISMEMIRAVFVTHDHADHIKAVGGLGEKQNIPIYTTARIHEKSYIRLSVTWKSSNPCSWKIFISNLLRYLMTARTMWAIVLR